MRCPQCDDRVLRKSDGGAKLWTKGPLVFDADGACRARCASCGTEVFVPVRLAKASTKIAKRAERFVLAES